MKTSKTTPKKTFPKLLHSRKDFICMNVWGIHRKCSLILSLLHPNDVNFTCGILYKMKWEFMCEIHIYSHERWDNINGNNKRKNEMQIIENNCMGRMGLLKWLQANLFAFAMVVVGCHYLWCDNICLAILNPKNGTSEYYVR